MKCFAMCKVLLGINEMGMTSSSFSEVFFFSIGIWDWAAMESFWKLEFTK